MGFTKKKTQKVEKAYENGEGSTKRAIRRGLELFSESNKGGPSSSSSGLISVIVISFALISKLVLFWIPFDPSK